MRDRQVSTTSYPIPIYMVDSTDHVTPKTGLTLTVTLSKNGGAHAAASGAVTEVGNGEYSLAGHATDRNTVGTLTVRATGAAADAYIAEYGIVTHNPYSVAVDVRTEMDANSTNLDAIIGYVDDLESRLTALRAGYLDNLSAGAVATQSSVDTIDNILDTEFPALVTAVDVIDNLLDTEIGTLQTTATAIKAKTDLIPAAPAAVGDIPTADENAEALLKIDWDGMTGEAARSVLNALRSIRNKVSISGTTMTVTKEDDSTSAWTAELTTDAAAEGIVGIDPT
jgi:hypothetical protein